MLLAYSIISVMHLGACATLLYRHHNNPTLKDVLRRLDKDCLIGTQVYSDPATGEPPHPHFPNKIYSEKKNTQQEIGGHLQGKERLPHNDENNGSRQ